MNCDNCPTRESVEIGKKTIAKTAAGYVRCFRLDCGHGWHVEIPVAKGGAIPGALPKIAQPASCDCPDVQALQGALVAGRNMEQAGDALPADDFAEWVQESVLPSLAPIPAKTLAGEAPIKKAERALTAKAAIGGKVRGVNVLLVGAINQLSD